jgi:hypothetical protein
MHLITYVNATTNSIRSKLQFTILSNLTLGTEEPNDKSVTRNGAFSNGFGGPEFNSDVAITLIFSMSSLLSHVDHGIK